MQSDPSPAPQLNGTAKVLSLELLQYILAEFIVQILTLGSEHIRASHCEEYCISSYFSCSAFRRTPYEPLCPNSVRYIIAAQNPGDDSPHYDRSIPCKHPNRNTDGLIPH